MLNRKMLMYSKVATEYDQALDSELNIPPLKQYLYHSSFERAGEA